MKKNFVMKELLFCGGGVDCLWLPLIYDVAV